MLDNKSSLRYPLSYIYVGGKNAGNSFGKRTVTGIGSVSQSQGSNRSTIVREAIVRYLEDDEDLALARQALAESGDRKSLEELRKDLGLDG
jgi:RHH-type transcriptional regulator, rel operon repressor / antitoxin RelB